MAIAGFVALGWTSSNTAETMASDRANKAVMNVLLPICLEQAKADPNYTEQIKMLGAEDYWKRGQQVADFGWATFHTGGKPNDGVCQSMRYAIIRKT